MTDDDIRRIVRETVRETLIGLGLDVSSPDEIVRRQADFAYLRKTREGAEELRRIARRSAVGIALSALAYGLWVGLKATIGRGP